MKNIFWYGAAFALSVAIGAAQSDAGEINCNSWNYAPASCATGVANGVAKVTIDGSGGLCARAGNYFMSGSTLNVINGCRGTFTISPGAAPSPSPSPKPSPLPPIFAVGQAGALAATTALTGQAPFSVHLSALLPVTDSCTWDLTTWRADGMHNVCATDKGANWSVVSTLIPHNFMPGASPADQACFTMPVTGAAYDVNSNTLINQIAACVHASDTMHYTQSYAWDFGDPTAPYDQVSGFNAAHVYSTPGTYLVKMNGSPLTVTVTANKRTVVPINTQADMDALAKVGNLAKVSNRWIQLKAGATFTVNGVIFLYSNDWMTGAATLVPASGTSFGSTVIGFPYNAAQVLVEGFTVRGNGTYKPMLVNLDGPMYQIVFKDIAFSGMTKGFDIGGGAGLLIQNVGLAPWTAEGLTSNYSWATPMAMSMYGNNFYSAANSGDGEPGIRFNGGQLISMVGNNIGGFIGKYDDISFRGAKNIYLGGNTVRGGVINTQLGTSQDAQPGLTCANVVIEKNTFDNIDLQIEGGTSSVRINGNTFTLHPSSDKAYYALYPIQNVQLASLGGVQFGLTTGPMSIDSNQFYFLETNTALYGETIRFSSTVNTTVTNNLFYTAGVAPFQGSPYPPFTGNTFYVGKLTDAPYPGNTVKLNTAFTPPAGI
jgi:hypothetical protein